MQICGCYCKMCTGLTFLDALVYPVISHRLTLHRVNVYVSVCLFLYVPPLSVHMCVFDVVYVERFHRLLFNSRF